MSKIRLSFDDGPKPTMAFSKILKVLKKHSIIADFYVNGSEIADGAAVLLMAHVAGHRIENHAWSHKKLSPMSLERVRKEVGDTQNTIKKITGRTPTRLRPPFGDGGFTRPMDPELTTVAKEFGLTVTLWQVDTVDWRPPRGLASKMDKIMMDVARQRNRALIDILMHVQRETARDLDALIQRLKNEGYTFG